MVRILLSVMLVIFSTQAYGLTIDALSLSPTWTLNTNYWTGGDNSNLDASEIGAIVGVTLEELYKNEVDNGDDLSFLYADYYETTYSNTSDDPADALIEFVGNPTADPREHINSTFKFLYVKDGQHDPAFYVFNISSWDGIEDLELLNFWASSPLEGSGTTGAISHVTILGNPSDPIPEPATMILFGAGLAGFAGSRFRRKK